MIRRGSIQAQMLAAAVLPLLLVCLVLGSYFIQQRVADTDLELAKRGETIAKMLAVTVEFGLLTGSVSMLEGQLKEPLSEPDVADIVVLDTNFFEVVRGGDTGLPVILNQEHATSDHNYSYFLAKVRTSGISFEDIPDESTDNQQLLGWVAVIMSREQATLKKQDIILKGVVSLFFGAIFGAWIGLHFSRNLVNGLSGLIQIMKIIEKGDLSKRANKNVPRGELLDLTNGFNSMIDQVAESKGDLMQKVEKATVELRGSMERVERQNEALHKARERADRANRAKDDFLARMSHELRTPMTSVLGFSKLLRKTNLNAEQIEYSRIIKQASVMLLSIIDDILDYSKLESNAIVLEEVPFSLQRSVRSVVEMMMPVANSKDVELVMVIDPEVPDQFLGDEVRLRQVLANLLSNAVKFTDEGEVSIQIKPAGRSGGYQLLDFDVIDSGIGIPKDQVNKLFKAFSQADTSITRRYGGSGLGLAITNRLVELMGGTIDLQSERGKGTSVRLSLPLKTEVCSDEADNKQVLSRIVVFEDNLLSRKAIRYQLYAYSTEVVTANNEQRLLELLNQPTQIVIVGLGAGEQISSAHIDCFRHIRALHKGVLVVLNSDPGDIPAELSVKQLRKPVNPDYLIDIALNHCDPVIEGDNAAQPVFESKLQILVAEDNSFNQLLLKRILEDAGIDIIQVLTGDEAVLCAKEFDPDLILMDVHMPDTDGIEATALIRKAGYDKPIIALTANVVEGEHQRMMQAGVNEVLLKPIDDVKLLDRIQFYEGARVQLQEQDGELDNTLDRYSISHETLRIELEEQIYSLMSAFKAQDRAKMRNHTHQLIGLAGLYDMPELDVASCELNDAAKHHDFREVWLCLWRLKRLIEHEQY